MPVYGQFGSEIWGGNKALANDGSVNWSHCESVIDKKDNFSYDYLLNLE